MIRRGIGVQSFVSVGVSTDADAQAFITAAGITDATQQSAINTLVTDLKGYGVWTKMKAIYPFVGGTASAHKFNLKDPRDLDAAFRLVFSGGGTHSSTGYLPNGVNSYADTFLTPSISLSQNSSHLSYYSRTDVSGSQVEIGSADYANTPFRPLYLIYRYNNTNYKAINNVDVQNSILFTPTTGLLIGSRINSTTAKFYHKGILSETLTANSTQINNFKIVIGGQSQQGTLFNYSTKQCAFASIGDGLTDTEASNLYTAVQAYQTTLTRQIAP